MSKKQDIPLQEEVREYLFLFEDSATPEEISKEITSKLFEKLLEDIHEKKS